MDVVNNVVLVVDDVAMNDIDVVDVVVSGVVIILVVI